MKSILAACAIAIGLAAVQPALAQVDLNPPYGDPAYEAYTVFSPDAASPEAALDQVVVVFHGFTSAMPNGTYKRVRKAFRETHTVIGLNYDPLDIERTLTFLDAVADKWLKGRSTTVFGTSLGAFWANLFGNRIGAEKIILINPVTEPARQLSKYADHEATNERRAQSFFVEAAALERYANLGGAEQGGLSRLVVLSANDDALDYRDALNVFAGRESTTVVVYPGGGHTLDLDEHPARAFIVDFVSDH